MIKVTLAFKPEAILAMTCWQMAVPESRAPCTDEKWDSGKQVAVIPEHVREETEPSL